jgi:hypothetical protein
LGFEAKSRIMGLFKKKKRKEGHALVGESPIRDGQAQFSGTPEARQGVATLNEAACPDQGKLLTEKHSLDTEKGRDCGDADIKSSRLKVRLRKSISHLFVDKSQIQQPALLRNSNEVSLLMWEVVNCSHHSAVFHPCHYPQRQRCQ